MAFNFSVWLWQEMAAEARGIAKQVKDPDLRLHMALRAARFLVWAKLAKREAARSQPDEQSDGGSSRIG